ncbi:hypothetical protein AB0N62_43755 [Streptomyces sp. NPDC093982]|jgi:hypothetical protein|uniref:hypothetical protein n=1 Tax=unclassified Streptomyces TaxID=2593676 RepID=UPI0034262940
MRNMLRRAAALAFATVTAALLTTGTAQAAPASDWAGCPYGAVCVYPQNQNPAVSPSHIYWTYGAHNLSNQYGNHWVLNNQYDGAVVELCLSYNANDCTSSIAAGHGEYRDLSPINSLHLRPHYN